MASKDDSNTPKQLKQDPLVEQLAPDPGSHIPTIQLTGWLGKGSKEGHWRLYLNPELDQYVGFSAEDVVHTQALDPKQSLLGRDDGVAPGRRDSRIHAGRAPAGPSRLPFRRHHLRLHGGNRVLPTWQPRVPGSIGRHAGLPVLDQSAHPRLPNSHRGLRRRLGECGLRHRTVLWHRRVRLRRPAGCSGGHECSVGCSIGTTPLHPEHETRRDPCLLNRKSRSTC